MSIIEQCFDISKPPVLVAELSANHGGKLNRALEIISAAADAGADAMKFQTYTADTMTLDCDTADFQISDPASLWHGHTLYGLYQAAHTPWEWHQELFAHARACGLEPFSAPFDASAVEFLCTLGVSCIKIASFENEDVPLLRAAARTGLPVIISSGMSSLESLSAAVAIVRQEGTKQLIVLKCCSAYPAPYREMSLRLLPEIAANLAVVPGLSDHSLGTVVPVAATALGARMIEKHLTLRRSDGGFDAAFSLEPHEFKQMAEDVRNAWEALGSLRGNQDFVIGEEEQRSKVFKRSLYIAADIRAGDVFTPENLRVIRPGFGLAPKHYEELLGKSARIDLARGTALRWEHVQRE